MLSLCFLRLHSAPFFQNWFFRCPWWPTASMSMPLKSASKKDMQTLRMSNASDFFGRRGSGDYAVVDTRSKSVVMFSRIYDKHAHKICREEAVPGLRQTENVTVFCCKFSEENCHSVRCLQLSLKNCNFQTISKLIKLSTKSQVHWIATFLRLWNVFPFRSCIWQVSFMHGL